MHIKQWVACRVMAAAIVVEDLVRHFGAVHALNGVSFEVPTGTVLGLLGPNGAGKTTAVRILTTVLAPTSGRATVAGHDVVSAAQSVRRSIGLAGQYAAIDENLTGRENLTLIGRLNHLNTSDAMRRADELLAQFKLTDAANRTARTYSGGMRRRLDLGAALVTHPPVLLLDEPTTGLDPSSRQDLWDVIETLVADGTTVLLTTQYLEEADRLADRIVVIDRGLLVAEGTPSQLKARLGESAVVLSFGTEDEATQAMGVLADFDATRTVVDPHAVSVPLRRGPENVRDTLNALDRAGIAVHRLDIREPSLDEVFLTLTASPQEANA
jgi:ABC-2 type transport system ATP-binding protein